MFDILLYSFEYTSLKRASRLVFFVSEYFAYEKSPPAGELFFITDDCDVPKHG